MAEKLDGNTFTFVWSVENYSMSTQVNEEFIRSPNFLVEEFDGAKFYLSLFRRQSNCHYLGRLNNDIINCVLRADIDSGAEIVEFDCTLSLIMENEFLYKKEEIKSGEIKNSDHEIIRLVIERNESFKKYFFFPNKALNFHCCLMPKTYKKRSSKTVFVKTTVQAERHTFVVPLISTSLDTSTSSNVAFQDCSFNVVFNCSSEHGEFKFQICCSDSALNRKREIKISRNNQSRIFLMLKGYLEDSSERVKPIFEDRQLLESNEVNLPLSKGFFGKLNPKDKLCPVRFELEISNGTYTPASSSEKRKDFNYHFEPAKNVISKTILQDKKFCDVTLKVEDLNFPAHKCFLCACSPVFSAMLESDMKEKETGVIEITDMSKEALQQLLHVIYTGAIDNLSQNNSLELYVAADKYQILQLKQFCSSFLEGKLTVETVCDTLEVANLCQDQYLEQKSRSYISSHAKKVFASNEWKVFMDKQLKLAADIMFENCRK